MVLGAWEETQAPPHLTVKQGTLDQCPLLGGSSEWAISPLVTYIHHSPMGGTPGRRPVKVDLRYCCHHYSCDVFANCPMLKDEVWAEVKGCSNYNLLCTRHAEQRLGRPLRLEDLKACAANQPFIDMLKRAGAEEEECPLESIRAAMCFNPRDYSQSKYDAWIYHIVVGWGDALPTIAYVHGWPPSEVARAERLRKRLGRVSRVTHWMRIPELCDEDREG